MTEPMNEREARKQYVRSRQAVVFTFIGAVMAAAMVISLLFYTGAIGSVEHKAIAVQPNFGVTAPCAPKSQDGNEATYANNADVTMRVLNGTKFSGFAKAVGDALENRNFRISSIDTFTRQNVTRTTIYFGKAAIPQAYTVASNFTDARMVMDDRGDKLIDVVVGATFNDLRTQKSVPAAGAKITNFSTCKPVDQMGTLPKAIAHDPVN